MADFAEFDEHDKPRSWLESIGDYVWSAVKWVGLAALATVTLGGIFYYSKGARDMFGEKNGEAILGAIEKTTSSIADFVDGIFPGAKEKAKEYQASIEEATGLNTPEAQEIQAMKATATKGALGTAAAGYVGFKAVRGARKIIGGKTAAAPAAAAAAPVKAPPSTPAPPVLADPPPVIAPPKISGPSAPLPPSDGSSALKLQAAAAPAATPATPVAATPIPPRIAAPTITGPSALVPPQSGSTPLKMKPPAVPSTAAPPVIPEAPQALPVSINENSLPAGAKILPPSPVTGPGIAVNSVPPALQPAPAPNAARPISAVSKPAVSPTPTASLVTTEVAPHGSAPLPLETLNVTPRLKPGMGGVIGGMTLLPAINTLTDPNASKPEKVIAATTAGVSVTAIGAELAGAPKFAGATGGLLAGVTAPISAYNAYNDFKEGNTFQGFIDSTYAVGGATMATGATMAAAGTAATATVVGAAPGVPTVAAGAVVTTTGVIITGVAGLADIGNKTYHGAETVGEINATYKAMENNPPIPEHKSIQIAAKRLGRADHDYNDVSELQDLRDAILVKKEGLRRIMDENKSPLPLARWLTFTEEGVDEGYKVARAKQDLEMFQNAEKEIDAQINKHLPCKPADNSVKK